MFENSLYFVHELICTKMDNQQLYDLNNNQLQVILTGIFGDGCISAPRSNNNKAIYSTSCKHREYLELKSSLLEELANPIGFNPINGYAGNSIHLLTTKAHEGVNLIRGNSIEENLKLVDDLGLVLWIYDDGSLHKTKLFYNLNTQFFSRELQEDLFVPFFRERNILAKVTVERKKDGREFYYLRISRYEGASKITKLLSKYPVDCYNYKLWSSETIQKWSSFQEEAKSKGLVGVDEVRKYIKFAYKSESLKGKSGRKPLIKI